MEIPLHDEGSCEGGTDVALVAQDGKVMVGLQQFCGNGHIRRMGGSQREVADDPAQGNEQMEFEAKECLLLGRTGAKGGSMRGPFCTRLRRMIKLDNGQWQTIDNTVGILCHIQHRQDRPSQQRQRILKIAAAAIEARAARQVRKQVLIGLPAGDEIGFPVPATTFSDKRHRQQFGITTARFWAGAVKIGGEGREGIADQDVHPGAKIGKVGYHQGGPPVREMVWKPLFRTSFEAPCQTFDLAQLPNGIDEWRWFADDRFEYKGPFNPTQWRQQ